MGRLFHQASTWGSGTGGRQRREQDEGECGCACAGWAEATGRRRERLLFLLVKVNSCGMEGKPSSEKFDFSGGEKGRFLPRLGNASISSGLGTVLFSLSVCQTSWLLSVCFQLAQFKHK